MHRVLISVLFILGPTSCSSLLCYFSVLKVCFVFYRVFVFMFMCVLLCFVLLSLQERNRANAAAAAALATRGTTGEAGPGVPLENRRANSQHPLGATGESSNSRSVPSRSRSVELGPSSAPPFRGSLSAGGGSGRASSSSGRGGSGSSGGGGSATENCVIS